MSTPEPADRADIPRRIAAIRATIKQGFAPTPEQERNILRTRAQALAREPESGVAAGATLDVVEFDLASERYALPLSQVREVSLLREVTPVPCTPPFVVGIINLRGEIRTVIDLKRFFDLPGAGLAELSKIILLEHEGWQLGIVADAIRGVRRIVLADLQPALPTLTDLRADYLRGITSDRVVVLDPAKLLSDPRVLVEDHDDG